MKARVKADFPYSYSVTSCGGRDFFKDLWSPVPRGFEEEALANPFLEVASEDVAPVGRLVSKAALQMAEEAGIDLDQVTGTGKNGSMTVADVRAFIDAQEKVETGAEPAIALRVMTRGEQGG